jgi:hypothetical protein
MTRLVLALALALAGAGPAAATQVVDGPRAAPLRKVRGIVARVEPLEGTPSSRVWILVLEDLAGQGRRWLAVRVPGVRDGTRVVVVPGIYLPRRGDRMVLSVHKKYGDDWLLTAPADWRTLRPGEAP